MRHTNEFFSTGFYLEAELRNTELMHVLLLFNESWITPVLQPPSKKMAWFYYPKAIDTLWQL